MFSTVEAGLANRRLAAASNAAAGAKGFVLAEAKTGTIAKTANNSMATTSPLQLRERIPSSDKSNLQCKYANTGGTTRADSLVIGHHKAIPRTATTTGTIKSGLTTVLNPLVRISGTTRNKPA